MIIWSDVVDIDASLSSVPAGTQAAILLDVRLQVSEAAWAERYDLASKYLAAHLGVMSERARLGGASGGVAGPVTSESADGVSRTFGATVGGGSTDPNRIALDATPWGREYQRLLRLMPEGLPFVV